MPPQTTPPLPARHAPESLGGFILLYTVAISFISFSYGYLSSHFLDVALHRERVFVAVMQQAAGDGVLFAAYDRNAATVAGEFAEAALFRPPS